MENIIVLDSLRIERHKPRKCTCEVRKFTIDTENREITCQCGMTVDPFEAMVYIAEHYERINRQHASLNEQRKEWIKQKPHSVLFKRMEQHYRKGEMLPYCPECNQLFDFKDINSYGNAEFWKRMKARQLTIDGV